MDFFSLLLLKPRSFEWAKDFLASPAWTALSKFSNGNYYPFSLPNSSPSVTISDYSCTEPPVPFCVELEDVEHIDGNPNVAAGDAVGDAVASPDVDNPKATKEEDRLAGK